MECYIADFSRLFEINVKICRGRCEICLLGGGLGARRQIQAFREFQRLKSFGNSRGKSYIHFL